MSYKRKLPYQQKEPSLLGQNILNTSLQQFKENDFLQNNYNSQQKIGQYYKGNSSTNMHYRRFSNQTQDQNYFNQNRTSVDNKQLRQQTGSKNHQIIQQSSINIKYFDDQDQFQTSQHKQKSNYSGTNFKQNRYQEEKNKSGDSQNRQLKIQQKQIIKNQSICNNNYISQNNYSQKSNPQNAKNKKLTPQQYIQSLKRNEKKTYQSQIIKPNQQLKLPKQKTILQLLDRKISVIWIFILNQKNHPRFQYIKERVRVMYSNLHNIVPLYSDPEKINDFIDLNCCQLKIVIDMFNSQEVVLGRRFSQKISEYYIFNQLGYDGYQQINRYKRINRNIKGVIHDMQKILSRAQEQVQNSSQLSNNEGKISVRPKNNTFPNFLELTHNDKTEATKYRINLYAASKLPQKQITQNFKSFEQLYTAKYKEKKDQKPFFQIYQRIDKLSFPISNQNLAEEHACNIIKMYTRPSFYHEVVNNGLRVVKDLKRFKPITLPFHQMFHSIRYLYQKSLNTQKVQQNHQQQYFRACKISAHELKKLQTGTYIEMFGFMSTSKKREVAKKFLQDPSPDNRFIVIHCKHKKTHLKKYQNIDYGFIDINQFKLAYVNQQGKSLQCQEQVLFNALNIFKVMYIKDVDGIKQVHLQYGAIFDLLQKNIDLNKIDQKHLERMTQEKQLNSQQDKHFRTQCKEYQVLLNFEFCQKLFNQIQDVGDVMTFQGNFEGAEKHYLKQIQRKIKLSHNYYKLADVQCKLGKTDDALKKLESARQELQKQLPQQCKYKFFKTYGIYAKQVQINLENKNLVRADSMMEKAIQCLKKIGDPALLQLAIKLKKQGDIKLEMGQVKNAEQKYKQSLEKIIETKSYPEKALKQQSKKYWWDFFFNFSKSQYQLYNEWWEKKQQISTVESFIKKKQQQVSKVMLNIAASIKKVCRYLGKKQSFQNCQDDLQNAYKIIQKMFQLSLASQNPYQKAECLSIKAQTMIDDYESLAQTEIIMLQCIKQIQNNNPVDIKALQFRNIIAQIQKASLDKYITPPIIILNEKPDKKIHYDQKERDQLYNKMKDNLKKILFIASYHTRDPLQIMQIKSEIGNLQYKMNNFQESQKYIDQIIAEFQQTDKQTEKKIDQIIAEFQQTDKQTEKKMKQVNTSYAMLYNTKANIHLDRGQLKLASNAIQKSIKKLQYEQVTRHLEKNNQQAKKKIRKLKQEQLRKNGKEIDQKTIKQQQQKVLKQSQGQHQKHRRIYQVSDKIFQIQLNKTYILLKQRQFKQAFQIIDLMINKIKKKVESDNFHLFLPSFLQSRAFVIQLLSCSGIEIVKNSHQEFHKCFKEAIQYRKKGFGIYHISHAKSICNYAAGLLSFFEQKDAIIQAGRQISKAFQILSSFDPKSPQYWNLYWVIAKHLQSEQKLEQSQAFYKLSLNLIQQRTNQSHIIRKQVKLVYTSVLSQIDPEKAEQQLLQLKDTLQDNIRNSKLQDKEKQLIQKNEKNDVRITLSLKVQQDLEKIKLIKSQKKNISKSAPTIIDNNKITLNKFKIVQYDQSSMEQNYNKVLKSHNLKRGQQILRPYIKFIYKTSFDKIRLASKSPKNNSDKSK